MRWLRILALAAALGLLPAQFVRADGLVKCTLALTPEIDCPSCESGIAHVLVTARGVDTVEVDTLNSKVVVSYDPARINVRALIGRIAVTGYTAKETK